MNLAKDERVQTIAMIGGLVGFAGLMIQIVKSKPVANLLAQFKQ